MGKVSRAHTERERGQEGREERGAGAHVEDNLLHFCFAVVAVEQRKTLQHFACSHVPALLVRCLPDGATLTHTTTSSTRQVTSVLQGGLRGLTVQD